MTNRYKIVKAEDGVFWCSLQPLQLDVNDAIVHLMEIDPNNLDEASRKELDLKIFGLKNVYQFLGSLILEKNLELMREEKRHEH